MSSRIIFLFSILIPLFSCQKEKLKSEPVPIEISTKAQEILRANNQFGFDMLKKTFAENPDDNLMISPLSIAQALSMTYNGANGETKQAFEDVLHFTGQTTTEINQTSLELTKALLNIDSRVQINIANSIWYRQDFEVEQDFINTNQTYYNAEVSALNFADATNSMNTINNWVDEKTNHKIEKIVDAINDEDIMFLINAIYFKGIWKAEFEKSSTQSKAFYLTDGSTKNVETMQIESDFSVFYEQNFSAIELPYGQGNYSMVILLPKDAYSLNELIGQLNEQNWNNLIQNMGTPARKHLWFPKFKFEYENELIPELTDLGLGIAFSDIADFTGINSAGNLTITGVKHKTFIEVNEEGTEAAAVTSVTVGTTSAGPDTNVFAIDHPFLFVIKEKYTNAILFMGTVSDPAKTGI